MADAPYYVIGIDGGGTGTTARLANSEGGILTVQSAGPANVHAQGVEVCARVVDRCVASLCAAASIPPHAVHALVFGAAGAGREADQQRAREAIESLWSHQSNRPRVIHVVSDADIALEAAFGGEPGVVVIAGTGSIVYGRNADGRIQRCGGWGPVIGDPGSGAALGGAALRHAAHVFDDCAAPGRLTELLKEQFGICSAESLIAGVYHDNIVPASLAPLVFDAGRSGDAAAHKILVENADDLARLFQYAARKLAFPEEIPVALLGGLFDSGNLYRELVTSAIAARAPSSVIRAPRFTPEEGAIAMGLRLAQTENDRAWTGGCSDV